jgi:predicted acylesterase/phospholipase RssA
MGFSKGGGAKGIMYAGALHEIREHGYWFRAVAGSSAGAITAALIAAGLKPDELEKEVPKGLHGVRIMPAGDLVGSPLLQSGNLASWLEQLLSSKVQRVAGVTVREREGTVRVDAVNFG